MSGPASFTCPRCGATSYHPKDVEFGYCGRCHDFTGTAPEFVDLFLLNDDLEPVDPVVEAKDVPVRPEFL